MKSQTVALGIMVAGVVVTWNAWLFVKWTRGKGVENGWQGLTSSVGNAVPEHKLWRDIKKTTVEETANGGFEPQFDDAVKAVEGTRVELPGVGFLLKSGIRPNENGEGEVTEFLLLPGDGGVAWCCGLSATPFAEISVLVQCPNDTFLESEADAKSLTVFVNAKGTLRLMKETKYNAFYTLENSEIEFINVKEIMPADVMNACLNQPMSFGPAVAPPGETQQK